MNWQLFFLNSNVNADDWKYLYSPNWNQLISDIHNDNDIGKQQQFFADFGLDQNLNSKVSAGSKLSKRTCSSIRILNDDRTGWGFFIGAKFSQVGGSTDTVRRIRM